MNLFELLLILAAVFYPLYFLFKVEPLSNKEDNKGGKEQLKLAEEHCNFAG